MFTDIYATIQASQVLQQGWRAEAEQARPGRLTALLRWVLAR